MAEQKVTMDEIVNVAKRRAFIYAGSEIYGGLANAWDYGPYGVLLKNNVKQAWWTDMVMKRGDIVGLDSAILMNPKVWEASGHIAEFTDPLVDCKECKQRFRADHLVAEKDFVGFRKELEAWWQGFVRWIEPYEFQSVVSPEQYILEAFSDYASDGHISEREKEILVPIVKSVVDRALREMEVDVDIEDNHYVGGQTSLLHDFYRAWADSATEAADALYLDRNVKCPNCGARSWGRARNFNLMFKTHAGPVDDEANVVYLRPETAQGIFVDFKNIIDTTRNKLPFGVAQIGKSFRNEITPGNFTFRTREFEQFEIEYFVKDALSAKKAFDEWVKTRFDWYKSLGVRQENLRLREHEKNELAHYAVAATDVEYNFPFGFSELEGIANRGNYDLSQHEKFSGMDLKYFDEETKTKVLPHVVEPSGGVDRAVLAFLVDAYRVEKLDGEERTVLKFHPRLAPIKVAVFPLIKKEPLIIKAKEILHQLQEKWFVEYDESGTVGRRYRRQDEIGTPYCITVDFDSLEDNAVTIRDRDTMKQERVMIGNIVNWLEEKLR